MSLSKLLALPILLAFACLLAGLYGMIHNQISYTVGPDYFHAFKFLQFHISPTVPPRVGAAVVGWQASWWMGVLIGAPIALVTLFMPTLRGMVGVFLRTAALVVAITLGLGLASLLLPVGEEHLHLIRIPAGVSDPVAFLRAGVMHDTSYLAGGIGLIIGLIVSLRSVIRARRGR